MSNFNQNIEQFLDSLHINYDEEEVEGTIRPDVALILLNKWIAEKGDEINLLGNPVQNEEQIKLNKTMLARQFPLVWNEKDTYQNVYPNFPKEDYINYLSKINNSYLNLPIPNYNPRLSLYDLPNYQKNWINISVQDFFEAIMERNSGRDYYGMTFKNLQKILNHRLISFIVKNYNSILSGKFNLSQEWCSANICPRFKGGDKKEPSRFRPLNILPLIVRIMDSIISKKLQDLIIQHNVIDSKVQKAIMKNSSGLWENVFGVNMKIKEMMDNHNDKLFFFIDLNNAFGSVNFRTMLLILQKYNFCPELSSYFERYYKNVFGIYQNEPFKWKNGLLQGSALSNVLFLLYIDYSLKNIFKDLKALKLIDQEYDLQDNTFAFVDDIVMILPRNDRVSKVLSLVGRILGYYGFTINQDKTYFILEDQSIDSLEYNGIKYKKASPDFKYLGQSLFIFQNEVLRDIFQKVIKSLETIDSFNIPNNVKAYVYYINVFMRINRVIECF